MVNQSIAVRSARFRAHPPHRPYLFGLPRTALHLLRLRLLSDVLWLSGAGLVDVLHVVVARVHLVVRICMPLAGRVGVICFTSLPLSLLQCGQS